MKKKFPTLKSHSQRLSEPTKSYPKTLGSDYEVRATEDVVVNGRIMKKTVYRIVRPHDKMKGLNALDFALENVIAAGALDSLRECYLGSNTLSELADGMEGTVDNAIAAVDAAENNNEETPNE